MSYTVENWHTPYGQQFENEEVSRKIAVPKGKGRGVKVYNLPVSPEGLYTWPWGYSMPSDFFADQFKVAGVTGHPEPKLCDDHLYNGRPVCFENAAFWTDLTGRMGLWRLVNPLKVSNLMDGTNKRLTGLIVEGKYRTENAWWSKFNSHIYIYTDGGKVWKSEIQHAKNTWYTNEFTENVGFYVDLEGVTDLDIGIEQHAGAYTGYVEVHDARITLAGFYESEIEPEKVTVGIEVLDMNTGSPVKDASVKLMTGNVVTATGNTDADGLISFPNVDEGAYTLKASKRGYEPLQQGIDATPPEVYYAVYMAPLPPAKIPTWAYVGVGAIGIVALVSYTKPTRIIERVKARMV